jgi:4-hydroxybenzoate polyprenyltransferase
MGFNRIVDKKYDLENPRTKNRAIPAGLISLGEAWVLVIISSALFLFSAAMLNRLALILSPVALAIIFGYSYAKRFTSLSHLVLGLCLGIAPVGAWIAVRGTLLTSSGNFDWPPVILAAAVTLWTAGFDILYSLQDIDFDRRAGLFSIPQKVGASAALLISRLAHYIAFVLLLDFGRFAGLGAAYYTGVAIIALSLVYEHALVHPRDFSKINAAFFTMNGVVSVVFFVFTLIDRILCRL